MELRLIDIGIVVFSTLAVVCIVFATIRLVWVKHKKRTSISDEERALRRWQNHRPVPSTDTEDMPIEPIERIERIER